MNSPVGLNGFVVAVTLVKLCIFQMELLQQSVNALQGLLFWLRLGSIVSPKTLSGQRRRSRR
jgi:hypothetical protein